MAFNIDNFIDSVGRNGTLQTNKFEVEIPIPTVIQDRTQLSTRILMLRAESVDMPGVLLDTVESRRYGVGPLIKTPSNMSRFKEVSINFLETEQASIYALFNDWLQNIVDFAGTSGGLSRQPSFLTSYKSDYVVDIVINVFNNAGRNANVQASQQAEPVLQFKLVDAFPMSVSDTRLAWSNNNQLFKTTAVFAYTHHQLIAR